MVARVGAPLERGVVFFAGSLISLNVEESRKNHSRLELRHPITAVPATRTL
jgi:uncharacterized membrane protein YgdD (TMEM256/DUF423 family)